MDPHLQLLLLLFHVLFFSALRRHSAASPSDEIRSLLEFRKGIRTDPSGVVDSWKPPSAGSAACPRDWHGISCDDSGAVVSIALDGLGLAGDLKFTTLTGLTSIRNLTLSGNAFTGRLVPAIGTLTSLQHLDLSGNLHHNLSSNNFTKGFPTEIWRLQQLRVLDLRSNNLRGDVAVLLSKSFWINRCSDSTAVIGCTTSPSIPTKSAAVQTPRSRNPAMTRNRETISRKAGIKRSFLPGSAPSTA